MTYVDEEVDIVASLNRELPGFMCVTKEHLFKAHQLVSQVKDSDTIDKMVWDVCYGDWLEYKAKVDEKELADMSCYERYAMAKITRSFWRAYQMVGLN